MAYGSTELDFPFNKDLAFTDARGRYNPRLEKRQRRLLANSAPLLKRVLEPDEEIHFVTSGRSPFSVLEFLTTGFIISIIKRCLIVITDRRLLHVPVNIDLAPKSAISQILYGDVTRIAVRVFLGRKLIVTYRDGSREDFSRIPRWAAKKLKTFLPERNGEGQASMASGRQHLCPRCIAILDDAERCAGCGLAFKEKKQALKYSVLYPGGGYFYTRHPWLGLGDAFVEMMFILIVVSSLFAALGPRGEPEYLPVAAIYGVLLGIEKLITIYHAQRYVAERIPADRDLESGTAVV